MKGILIDFYNEDHTCDENCGHNGDLLLTRSSERDGETVLTEPQTSFKGTLTIGDNSGQVAEFVLKANRGEFKEYPLLGAEVTRMLKGAAGLTWTSDAKDMLNACGLSVSYVKIKDNGEIVLE